MSSHEKIDPAVENALNAAQVEFTANPRFLDPRIAQVWRAQALILDEVERFSTAWLRRRQEAVEQIAGAGRQIVAEGRPDPAGTLRHLARLQADTMARLAEDAADCAQLLHGCAAACLGSAREAAPPQTGATVTRPAPPEKTRATSQKPRAQG